MTDPNPPASPLEPSRGRFQLGLRALFWLVAALAVWMTVEINRRENARLAAKVAALSIVARDLVVDDPGQYALVKLHDLWNDQTRWDAYLPPGRYRVSLASRGIEGKGFAAPMRSAEIDGGKHRLILEQADRTNGPRFLLKVDGRELFAFEEGRDWESSGWSSQGSGPNSRQQPITRPLEMIRRQNLTPEDSNAAPKAIQGPRNGLLLWIERIEAGPPSK